MPAPPRHPTPPFNNLHPHDRKNMAVMGISISYMRHQSPGKSPRRTDLLSPLRLYQQHNDLFQRTGAGATQSKTPKRGSPGGPSCIVFGFPPRRPSEEHAVGQLDIQSQPYEVPTNSKARHDAKWRKNK